LKPQPYQYPPFSNTQSSPFASYTPFYQQPHNITTPHDLNAGISNSPSTFTSSLTPTSQLSSYITPSSIPYTNTHISPPHSYSNFIANNSSHYLPHHINIAIQELQRSQKACIQAISNLATEISTLNQSLTPPNYTHRFPDQLYASHKPFTHQQPHTISISDPILENTVEFTDTEPLKLEPDLTIHSDPVLPVIGEQHAAKDLNDEAPSNLVLDFTTTFPSPKTEDPLRADNVTVKDQGEDNHRLSPSIIPSPCNSDRVESSTSQSCISVPMSLAPVKHCLVTTIRPSPEKTVASTVVVAAPLQRHLFIFDFGGDERRVHSLAAIFGNGDCVFDPGGDKCIFCSPALISINNYGTQSPLQLPWDRGKLGVSKSPISVQSFECFLFTSIRSITPPVTIFDPGGDKFNPVEDSGGSHGGRRVAVNGLQ
jgi:hypothetical protein